MPGPLESALSQTESDATATVRAADQAVKAAKKLATASRLGDLGALEKAMVEAEGAVQALRLQFNSTKDGWSFDAGQYAQEGRLLEELRNAATEAGLSVHEEDGRLFSYPVLVRVIPAKTNADVAVSIDRKKTKGVRPSLLAAQLIAERDRTPKFNPGTFLDALYKAYLWAVKDAKSQPSLTTMGPSIPLTRIYELLTLFPGQSRDYTRQEFTRDIYLLDRSGRTSTNQGARLELSRSTGTRSRGNVLELVDQEGRAQVYYAISFSKS